jgi:hypothetical protein
MTLRVNHLDRKDERVQRYISKGQERRPYSKEGLLLFFANARYGRPSFRVNSCRAYLQLGPALLLQRCLVPFGVHSPLSLVPGTDRHTGTRL